MSDPSILESGSACIAAYPDDVEANICVTDILRVYCEHTIDEERRTANDRTLFEVVPPLKKGGGPKRRKKGSAKGSGKRNRKGGEQHHGLSAEEEVTLVYSGDKEPTLVKSPNGHDDATLEKKSPEGGAPRYTLKCRAPAPELALLKKTFWQKLREPNVYEIQGIADSPFKVKAYCPDRYALETDFPAMRSISGGVKIQERQEDVSVEKKTVTSTVEKTSWSPTSQQLKTVDAKVESGSDGATAQHNQDEQTAPTEVVRIRRNDQYVEANVAKLASSGLELAAQVQKMIELVQDNVPKFGWYVEASVQVMQGTLSLQWGWREYAKAGRKHRAFYWLAINADVAILQASLELGVAGSSCRCSGASRGPFC
ncbi:hypothetical protein BSZ35_07090 [Salinibacter sp. 10B]|uniref:hypothetical protein n=1 Tax=Salinibacter sp. 10B TaxID=1923971 RepID=UPI000CF3BE5F|nr:hypothetical protein [Salinibacter sp. 10B]PQJ34397.1 hypothetical protein BSZ35_07090 [Salinibacter sp. 10B]